MSITPVGAGTNASVYNTANFTGTSKSWTLTPKTPSGTQVGDWLIVLEEWNGPPPSDNYTPPGYYPPNTLAVPASVTAANVKSRTYYRSGFGPITVYLLRANVAGAQSIGDWTLTCFAPTAAFAWADINIWAVRGGHNDGPPQVYPISNMMASGAGDFLFAVFQDRTDESVTSVQGGPNMTIDNTVDNVFGYRYTSAHETMSSWGTGRRTGVNSSGQVTAEWECGVLFTEGHAPNAPIQNGPSGNVDNTQAIVLSTTFSDQDADDYQTQLDIQYRKVGAGSWTTVTAANTSGGTYSIPANTLSVGAQYEWQARSTDSTNRVGPWSASAYFTPQTPPSTPSTFAPTAGTTVTALASSPFNWTAAGSTVYQARRVADSGGSANTSIVYEDSGPQANAATWTFSDATAHLAGGAEHWQVRVAQYAGLWSPWADVAVTYAPAFPPRPTIVTTPNPATGSVTVAITNPSPGAGQVATDHVDLYRTWLGVTVPVALGLAPNSTFTDYLAGPSGPGGDDNYYNAIAYSADWVPIDSGVSFAYTGAAQSWTVPAYVYAIDVTLYGAGDGGSAPGGVTQQTIPVAPGDVVTVNAGGAPSGITGGWNGGGTGRNLANGGKGGGGATDIRIGGTALANRICVAGGAGARFNTDIVGSQGGGTAGGAGVSGAGGGTQSAGGAAYGTGVSAGSLGQGGGWTSGSITVRGGGGGYYGGGGETSGEGAGGGSGYLNPTAPRGATSNGTTTQGGGNTGNGSAVIIPTFTPPA